MSDYYIKGVRGEEVVFDASTDGAIAPDGNPAWVAYLEWCEAGNVAPPYELEPLPKGDHDGTGQ